MMKFETLLPVFAPTPAGLVIAIRLYQEILNAVGTSDVIWQGIAGVGACVGCIGMIGAEMYAYKQAGIAVAERQIGAAIVALVAALVCSGLIIWAIGTGDNTRPLISAVVVAIAAYVVLALRDFLARKREIRTESQARVDVQNSQLLGIEKEKTKQAAAAARYAKASAAAPVIAPDESFRKVSESFGSWPNVPQADRIRISVMSKNEIMAAYNVSERTALNWMKYSKGATK